MTNEEPRVSDNGLYNTTDTCKALGVTYKTLIAMVCDGRIKCGLRRGVKRERRVFRGIDIKKAWRATA